MLDLETAIDLIESGTSAMDESTPVGEAWSVVLDELTRLRTELAEAKAQLTTATRKVEVLTEGLGRFNDSCCAKLARDTLARADAVGKEKNDD